MVEQNQVEDPLAMSLASLVMSRPGSVLDSSELRPLPLVNVHGAGPRPRQDRQDEGRRVPQLRGRQQR